MTPTAAATDNPSNGARQEEAAMAIGTTMPAAAVAGFVVVAGVLVVARVSQPGAEAGAGLCCGAGRCGGGFRGHERYGRRQPHRGRARTGW